MGKLAIFKTGTGIAISLGCMQIIGGIVGTLVPRKNLLEKTTVFCAEFAIGSVIADVAVKHFEEQLEKVVKWVADHKEEIVE